MFLMVCVSFEEFEKMVTTLGPNSEEQKPMKSANHWRDIVEKVPLTKGAKTAIRKLNELNVKKNSNVTRTSRINLCATNDLPSQTRD